MSKRGFDEISTLPEPSDCFDYNFDLAFDYFVDPTYFGHGFQDEFPLAREFNHVMESPTKRAKTQHEYFSEPLLESWCEQVAPTPSTDFSLEDEAYADLLSQSIGSISNMQNLVQDAACILFEQNRPSAELDLVLDSPTQEPAAPVQLQHLQREILLANDPRGCAVDWSQHEEARPENVVLSLSPETLIPSVWYCDRPFPHFTLEVLDKETSRPITRMDHAQVTMKITNGFGEDSTSKAYGNVTNRCYPICSTFGRATVAGLRFSAVSSKQGGHFQLVATLSLPDHPNVSEWSSQPIQILSYRLYHAPKLSTEQLTGRDSVGKMKGIGAQYAKRLKSEGIVTVGDLAAIDLEVLGHQKCEELLQRIRKDRGSMTLAKLSDYIQQARDIVARSQVLSEPVDRLANARVSRNSL